MKKVFVLSDIHANLEALKCVISAIGNKTFIESEKLFLGDYVDFGPWPNETISLLRSLPNAHFILGNHDLYVLDETNKHAAQYFKRADLVEHIDWTRAQLSPENKAWLSQQPQLMELTLGGKDAIAFHGEYNNPEKGLTTECIITMKQSCILCGHIHAPYVDHIQSKLIINPGSVGESLDGNNNASYAVIEDNGDSVKCTIERIPYNLEKVKQEMDAKEMPLREEFINTMRKGKFEGYIPR